MSEKWNGVDRRLDKAEEFGEMKASVTNNTQAIEKLTELFEKHTEAEQDNVKELKDEIRKIHEEFIAYRTFMRFVKGLGAIAVLLLSFKFGDIVDVWRAM